MNINLEQDLLKRNADLEKELAVKNRELEIEASLERVRMTAMEMKNPADMLHVCRMISDQLLLLGFKEIRNVQTVIIYPQRHEYLNYQYFTPYDKDSIETIDYRLHPDVLEFTNQMLASADAYYYKAFEGEDLKVWREYRKQTNQLPDPKLDATTSSHYYFYSIGSGALGVTTYAPLNEEQIDLFKRFRNVFELAYRRFIDIEKAHAQAREAQIEAALERVRAGSMAMHHSDDLVSVINIVQEQLLGLGFHFHGANFVTDYSEKGYTMWLASPGESFPYKIYVPQIGQKYFEAVKQAIEKGSDFATYALNFEEKNIYFKNLFENSLAKNTSEEGKRIVYESKGMAASVVLLDKVRLNLMNLDMVPFTDEENDILKRFGYVFEQSYTRFLDLQKAEAQAREAQIEAGLERVRSRTMGMHKSDDLLEVVASVFQHMQLLGFNLNLCNIVLIDSKTLEADYWASGSEQVVLPESYHIPYFDHPLYHYQLNTWKNAEQFAVFELSGDVKKTWDEILFTKTDLERLPDATKRMMQQLDKVIISSVATKHGLVQAIGTQQLSDDDVSILSRFAKVFEQTYTRFLDLQKAEEQAREAQIEAALERVRGRSMAMHKSDELREVVAVLFAQLQYLGFDIKFCSIALIDKINSTVEFWLSGFSQEILPESYHVPNLDHPFYRNFQNVFQQGIPYHVFELYGEEKKSYDKLWFTLTDFKNLPEPVKKPMMEMERVVLSCAFTKNGMIQIGGFAPLPDTDASIVQRFAKVFEQTHTRFLDLQKAEAQARESQIQLAMERVRARTMAMQRSEELAEVATVLFQQVKALGISQWVCGFNIWEIGDKEYTWYPGSPDGEILTPCKVPLTEHPVFISMDESRRRGDELFVYEKEGEFQADHYRYMMSVPGMRELLQNMLDSGSSIPNFQIDHIANFSHGSLIFITYQHFPEMHDIFKRFAKVFEQTYTRFLDLQKAEAQAREAQIEAGLERVRSRSLAMHNTSELQEVIHTVHKELLNLNIAIHGGSFIAINRDIDTVLRCWGSGGTANTSEEVSLPLYEHPFCTNLINRIKGAPGFFTEEYTQQQKKDFFTFLFKHEPWSNLDAKQKNETLSSPGGYTRSCYVSQHTSIFIINHFGKKFSAADNDILQRFGKVFEQTYTRFLDLQKAEAQARDAQIEVALERVRAKVMAMTSSNDLNETSLVFGEQLRKLGIDWQFSYFWLVEEAKNENTFWITWPDNKTSFTTYTLAEAEEYFNDCLISWRAGVKIHDNYVPPEGVKRWIDTFQRIADDAGGEAKKIMVPQTFANGVYYYDAMMKYGSFGICISKPATDEEKKIQCRFAIEFERAYSRFLDLQKAEAQAREAQIEAALERVRSKAMAMHKTEDFNPAVVTVFEELEKLDLGMLRCGIGILNKETRTSDVWTTAKSGQGNIIQVSGNEPMDIHPLLYEDFEAWVKQKDFSYVLQGQDMANYYRALTETNFQLQESQLVLAPAAEEQQFYYATPFEAGTLFAFRETAFPEEAKVVMKRFANVFNLTYKRFLDLQKAEAQAREAQIETALEKVRASTMAMQRSEDLSQTAFVLFNQFKELGEAPERIFIATFDDHDSGVIDLWGTDQGGNQLNKLFKLPVNEPTMVSKIIAAWREKKRSLVVDLQGEELQTYLGFLKQAGIPVTDGLMPDRRVQTVGCFSNGVIGVTTSEPQSSESVQLLERFAGVFDLTYRRFLDLQKAEAQAREAKIETALERVRARALAMQAPEELKDVAQVLRTEMGSLGVEELETSSIYIHPDNSEMAECWYALKDPKETEKRMVVDHFQLDLRDTWVGREMQKFYTSNKHQTSIVMQGAHRKEWIEYCYKHSPVFTGFYGETIPDRTYHLYKFSHGYIGAAAPGEISNESWRLLGRAASVFSLAYSRFKDLSQARIDLIKLKEEKKKAEDALTELQVTQKQLIQAEKMASLGELTAGIAHEIQNPLNFVNNFSDVSNELLEEMRAELEKGNAEEAKAIAVDVKENLEKILHHGKRADAIVKGMLQHSRNSSGQKELTDINVLAEEYLRLAYHGLRAKDKFFNAKFETDLDPSIDKIHIVPQEIGRVILNLINNSFYAVSEKKKNTGNGYEPIVTVSTKAIKPPLGGLGAVEIRVKDNGNGIPQKALNKIFQPFFTTKPTGQGTGLGLSLSYDIITKGHDGEIKVETKEGEGSEFIISLPVN